MNEKPILVYGAAGTQGSAVARKLLEAGERVRVLVRDPHKAERWRQAGAEIAVVDYLDRESLMAAHQGVERVFLVLPLQFDFDLYRAYARNAIDAAAAAGIKHLVFNTSSHVAAGTQVNVYRVKVAMIDYLHERGVPSIILRPTIYMDNLIGPWMKSGIIGQGVVAYPLPTDFQRSWICADDAAALSIAALNRPDLAGSTFEIGGPEALDGSDIAEQFTNLLGRQVHYIAISPNEYEQALVKVFGPTVAFEVAEQVRWMVERPNMAVDMSTTAELFSVELTPLEQWIKKQDWSIPA
jgi:uncharacterized protein YbjT (DUF2867 family)